MFPTVLQETHLCNSSVDILSFSRINAFGLLLSYVCFLIFQLKTHKKIYSEAEDDSGDGEGHLKFWVCFVWLGIITLFISLLSDYMVDTIEGAAKHANINELFLSTIVIPIVGNAAEHASAIIFAVRNKMEIAMGVAVGSAIQIALSVIPFCVLFGWAIDSPLSMNLHIFEAATLLLTVLLVSFVIQSGESHWLQGLILIFSYLIVSAGFYVHVDDMNAVDARCH